MRYQLKPFYVEAVQWFPGVCHPRIYACILTRTRHLIEDRIKPSGVLEYTCGNDALVIDTQTGQIKKLTPGDWVVIAEDTGYLVAFPDHVFQDVYTHVPDESRVDRSRVVSI